ncbi:MAG: alpha/beta fold hydrolase [Paenalcaligenes sp.]
MSHALAHLHYPGALLAVDNMAADECIIAVHSIGVDAQSFATLFSKLGTRYACLSYDLRGHGAAAALQQFDLDALVDDAVNVVESCRISNVHLVGHSIGGVIAALAAAKLKSSSSHRVQSLSVIASPPTGLAVFSERAQTMQHESRESIIATTLQRWFGGLDVTPAIADAMQYARQQLSVIPVGSLVSSWQSLAQFSGYGALGAQLPATLLITGNRDLSTPVAAMQPILDALHQAGKTQTQLQIIEGGGHMLPLTPTDTLIADLLAHFEVSRDTNFR